jgi:hypothetical protein
MSPVPPRAHVCLPPLDGRTALILVQVLENVIDAIWDAHRDAIDEVRSDLSSVPPSLPPPPPTEDDDLF